MNEAWALALVTGAGAALLICVALWLDDRHALRRSTLRVVITADTSEFMRQMDAINDAFYALARAMGAPLAEALSDFNAALARFGDVRLPGEPLMDWWHRQMEMRRSR